MARPRTRAMSILSSSALTRASRRGRPVVLSRGPSATGPGSEKLPATA